MLQGLSAYMADLAWLQLSTNSMAYLDIVGWAASLPGAMCDPGACGSLCARAPAMLTVPRAVRGRFTVLAVRAHEPL